MDTHVVSIGLELVGAFVLLIIIYILGRPVVHGTIYAPTSNRSVAEMVKLADPKPGDRVIDLGSGDGRIVIAFAERGAMAVGYEINPLLVAKSRKNIERAEKARPEIASRAMIEWKSFWDADLSQFDIVIVYSLPHIIRDFKKKFDREMRPGAKVIMNVFEVPGWTPIGRERNILLYEKT